MTPGTWTIRLKRIHPAGTCCFWHESMRKETIKKSKKVLDRMDSFCYPMQARSKRAAKAEREEGADRTLKTIQRRETRKKERTAGNRGKARRGRKEPEGGTGGEPRIDSEFRRVLAGLRELRRERVRARDRVKGREDC